MSFGQAAIPTPDHLVASEVALSSFGSPVVAAEIQPPERHENSHEKSSVGGKSHFSLCSYVANHWDHSQLFSSLRAEKKIHFHLLDTIWTFC